MIEAGMAFQPLRVMVAHHGDTASRGRDYVIVVAKYFEKSFGKRPGLFRTAGVGHGLAAAGLLCRELDVDAELPEHAECGKADLRVELIDVARDEESDSGHLFLARSGTLCAVQCAQCNTSSAQVVEMRFGAVAVPCPSRERGLSH